MQVHVQPNYTWQKIEEDELHGVSAEIVGSNLEVLIRMGRTRDCWTSSRPQDIYFEPSKFGNKVET